MINTRYTKGKIKMNNNFEIVIDTLGSDQGPAVIILGASKLLKEHPDLKVILVGDESLIKEEIAKLEMPLDRIKIIHSTDTITNLDNIINAFYDKPNASILLAIKELSENENAIGMLSAGNSGAILLGSIKFLRREDARPCIAAVLPCTDGSFTCLVDTGATIDCTSKQLHEFAILGKEFMHNLFKIDNPRIGLLSNGAEPTKGNKLVKETFHILEEDPSLNFIGNVEGNKALSGVCDVLVADGFAANQVLKVTEGTAARIITDIVKYIKMNNRPDMMPLVQHLMKTYDISSLGGGILLGAKKTVIKCRGNSGEEAIFNTGNMLINLATNKAMYEKE